jgi:PAS domain S-box-containing protein
MDKANAHTELENSVADRTAELQRINAALQVEIAERIQVEEALRQSEERYRTLVEGSVQGIAISRQEKLLFANTTLAHILGYDSAADLIGKSVWAHVAPHEIDRLRGYFEARQRGEPAPSRCEFQAVKKDGTPIWIERSVTPITWAGDTAYLRTYIDITERKRAENALHTSEELNRRIVEAVPGGIVQVTRDGGIIRANHEAQKILGLSYDELTRRFITDFEHQTIREDGRPCAVEDYPVTKCLASGTAQPGMTLGVRRPDGSIAWAIYTAIPLVDPATGDTTGAVVTFLNITERKRLEDQLRQVHKMQAIGTLAGGIAHDFNNILAAILGYTELALSDVSAGSVLQHNLHEVLKAGHRARDLVRQILAFSRQDSQERQPLTLHSLVQEALTMLRASLPTTITMQQHVDRQAGTILANPTQMHQVLMNLCTNAEYAMRNSGGVLDVGVDAVLVDAMFAQQHAALQPGPYVRLTVRDTGDGMPPEVLERIFEPFFTTKGVGEGTGMGLAVVHGIVSNHSGAIIVQSALGAGTTFAIYLPPIAETGASENRREEALPQGQGRILFVDDEEALAQMAQALLTRIGYEVVIKTSSIAALETFRITPQRFDLIITDQTMPAMTGEVLAREIRRLRPDIPIILCTGFSYTMDADKATTLGINAFLMKPLVAQDLSLAIRQVFT